MKSFDEQYKEFCQEDQLKSLWLEEKVKREKKKKKFKIILLSFLIVVIALVFIFKDFIYNIAAAFYIFLIPFVFVCSIIFGIIAIVVFGKYDNKYKMEFKNKIINTMIGNFYTDLEYYPNKRYASKDI